MRLLFLISMVLSLFSNRLFSQTIDLGSWNVFNFKYNSDDNLSFFGEAQLRSLKLYEHFHYYEYKGGINYKIHKNLKLTLAGGSYQTYKEGGNFVMPKNNNEFRLWPQLSLFQSINNFKIEQRYRAEMRFTNNGYRNRFRYRLGVSYPFGGRHNDYKTYQISASNEIFFTDKEAYFERNRMILAFNYKPSKASTLQIGYLHQLDYKINGETGRDFLQIGYFVEFFPRKANNISADTDIKDN